MIKIVNGDLLNATENIIGHQVNCQAKMNSGVAKQIRHKYPIAYNSYMHSFVHNGNQDLLGTCEVVKVNNNKFVANIYGQFNYGYNGNKYTDTAALKHGLIALKDKAIAQNLSVALPYKIGSDRGGADWNEVYEIIDEVFADYDVTLYKLEV